MVTGREAGGGKVSCGRAGGGGSARCPGWGRAVEEVGFDRVVVFPRVCFFEILTGGKGVLRYIRHTTVFML